MSDQMAIAERQKVVAVLLKMSEPGDNALASNRRQALCSTFGLKRVVHVNERLEVAFTELHHFDLKTGFRAEGGKRPLRARAFGTTATRAAITRELRNGDNTTYLRFPHRRPLRRSNRASESLLSPFRSAHHRPKEGAWKLLECV